MASESLHIVLIPFLAQGHMIPMMDLAGLLSEHGVQVTFVSTPVNLSRIQAFVRRVQDSALPIEFLSLRIPTEEVGLPPGSENTDLIRLEDDLPQKLFKASSLMREPLQHHLQQSSPPPSCIVSDFCTPWTRHVARELGIPRFDFYSVPCFSLLCEHNLTQRKTYDGVDSFDVSVVVPDLPIKIEVTQAQAPGLFPGPLWKWMDDDVKDSLHCSQGVIINTFAELEPEYIKLYEEAKGKKVWPVGPVSQCNQLDSMASRGNKSSIEEQTLRAWLDSQKQQSVLYVSFGTLVRISGAQLIELGLGLEDSGCPAIWVTRPDDQQQDFEEWLAGGFEERTRDRIIIIKGWAPQLMILSHPSVGGFLTHCGWNSCLEGIAVGVPLLTWPGFVDQFLNERFIVDVLRVGAPSGINKPFWHETVVGGEVQLKGEDVKTAVEKLMGTGREAEEMRRRVGQLGRMARCAMEAGGSSEKAIIQLINELRCLVFDKMGDQLSK